MAVTVELSSPLNGAINLTSNTFKYVVGGTGSYNATEILFDGAQVFYAEHGNIGTGTKNYTLSRDVINEGAEHSWQVKIRDSGSGIWVDSAIWTFTTYSWLNHLTDIYPADGAEVEIGEQMGVSFWMDSDGISMLDEYTSVGELYGGYTSGSLSYIKNFETSDYEKYDAYGLEELIEFEPGTWYWRVEAYRWWWGLPWPSTDEYSIVLGGRPNKPIKPTPSHLSTGIKLGLAKLSWESGS